MTNYEAIQTMTVKELANLIKHIEQATILCVYDSSILSASDTWESWLRQDSQTKYGLLTDEMKKYWKVH